MTFSVIDRQNRDGKIGAAPKPMGNLAIVMQFFGKKVKGNICQ
jgi:hypothetical protein